MLNYIIMQTLIFVRYYRQIVGDKRHMFGITWTNQISRSVSSAVVVFSGLNAVEIKGAIIKVFVTKIYYNNG